MFKILFRWWHGPLRSLGTPEYVDREINNVEPLKVQPTVNHLTGKGYEIIAILPDVPDFFD